MISTVSGAIISAKLRDAKLRPTAIAEIVAAVKSAGGRTVDAAKSLGVSYQTLGNWRAKYPILERHIVNAQRELGWLPPGAALGSRREPAVRKKKRIAS